MNPSRSRLVLAVLALALAALPAAAEIYTVKLVGGTSFLTRYEPQPATWDPETLLFLSDVGNWVALPKAEVESVTSQTENRGFGRRISATTVVIGWTANDAPVEGDATGSEAPPIPSAFEQFLTRSYDQKQFVEPGQAGGGIPVYGVPYGYSGSGGSTSFGSPAPSTPPDGGQK
jgi:hypothetical protein